MSAKPLRTVVDCPDTIVPSFREISSIRPRNSHRASARVTADKTFPATWPDQGTMALARCTESTSPHMPRPCTYSLRIDKRPAVNTCAQAFWKLETFDGV
jgi:hypothetical protein